MRAVDDPDHHDREHGAIEAPDRIEGCAVSRPGEEDRHEDQRAEQFHGLVAQGNQWQHNEAPVDELTDGLRMHEVMQDAMEIGNVVEQPSIAVHRWLERRRIKEHGCVEGDTKHRGHNRNPFEPSL